jgi:hypothetical protein
VLFRKPNNFAVEGVVITEYFSIKISLPCRKFAISSSTRIISFFSFFFDSTFSIPGSLLSLGIHRFRISSSLKTSIGFVRKSLKPFFINISLIPKTALAVNAIIGSCFFCSSNRCSFSQVLMADVALMPSISGIM